MSEKNYFITIDRQTKNAKEVPPLGRLIHGDICTLAKRSGECFATNRHFAKEYKVSTKTICRLIATLKKEKKISVSFRKTEHGNFQRYITPLLSADTPKVSNSCGQKCLAPPDKNVKHNINKKNNISNSFSKKDFNYLD